MNTWLQFPSFRRSWLWLPGGADRSGRSCRTGVVGYDRPDAALARLVVLTLALAGATAWAQPAPNLGATAVKSPPLAKKVVVIGGRNPELPAGQHDFLNGVPVIAGLLRAAPAFAGADVLVYTGGWPADPTALQGASALVLYVGAQEKLEPAQRRQLEELVAAGAGLVGVHGSVDLGHAWFGVQRAANDPDVVQTLALAAAKTSHPVLAGLTDFSLHDKFHPTAAAAGARVVPLLSVAEPAAAGRLFAWAFEREGGGRSVGFSGGHLLTAFDAAPVRQLLVNAIAWSARLDVPAAGIAVPGPVVTRAMINRRDENQVTNAAWGELRWYTSAAQGNTRTMTTGVAILKPGQGNPRHFHPNCDEILHVVSGRIRHTMNEVTTELSAGDTISIPSGVLHNAVNIGDGEAVLAISFSTAYREAVGYTPSN